MPTAEEELLEMLVKCEETNYVSGKMKAVDIKPAPKQGSSTMKKQEREKNGKKCRF